MQSDRSLCPRQISGRTISHDETARPVQRKKNAVAVANVARSSIVDQFLLQRSRRLEWRLIGNSIMQVPLTLLHL